MTTATRPTTPPSRAPDPEPGWFRRVVGALKRLVRRLIHGQPSPAEARAEDRAHQARVRRELRGLPPDHDSPGDPPRPAK